MTPEELETLKAMASCSGWTGHAYSCDFCAARPGQPCTKASGDPAGATHANRRHKAAEAYDRLYHPEMFEQWDGR